MAEQTAAQYLEKLGFTILARNWRNRWCEVDIVAERGDELHIVEVKYRRHSDFGGGFGAITVSKQSRLLRAAQAFARQPDRPVLIDVVAVSGSPEAWQIELIENAVESA